MKNFIDPDEVEEDVGFVDPDDIDTVDEKLPTEQQPLLKEHHATQVKDVPEAMFLLAKGALVDFPATIHGFVSGLPDDLKKGIETGAWDLSSARDMSEYRAKIVERMTGYQPSQGASQIAENLMSPLETVAKKGGEIMTDLVGPGGGAVTYATLQLMPFLLGGQYIGKKVSQMQNKPVNPYANMSEQQIANIKEAGGLKLDKTYARELREQAKANAIAKKEAGAKAPLNELKSDLISATKERVTQLKEGQATMKELQEKIKTDPNLAKDPQFIELSKGLQDQMVKTEAELNSLVQANKAVGDVNAGTIPEGTVIKLAEPIKPVEPLSKPATQAKKEVALTSEEPNIFKATDNIKERQAELKIAKDEVAKVKTEVAEIAESKVLSKEERLRLIKERAETLKKKEKEVERQSGYEDAMDNIEQQVNPENVFFKEGTSGKVYSAADAIKISKEKSLDFGIVRNPDGSMQYHIKDKYGNVAKFDELSTATEYSRGWTDSFADNMSKSYEAKKKAIEVAPELVKFDDDLAELMNVSYEKAETIAAKYSTKQPVKSTPKDQAPPTNVGEVAKEPVKSGDKKTLLSEKDINEIDNAVPVSEKIVPEPYLETIFPKDSDMFKPSTAKRTGLQDFFMVPTKFVFEKIETATGFPLMKHFNLTQEGLRQANLSAVAYQRRLRQARKGHNRASEATVYRALERPQLRESGGSYYDFKQLVKKDSEANFYLGKMSMKEFESAKAVRGILEDAAKEFGIPIDKMVQDYAPRLLKEGVSWEQAIQKWGLPEEFKWASMEQRTGHLRDHSERIFEVTSSYINRGARKRYVGDYLDQFSKEVNGAKMDKASGDLVKGYIETLRSLPSGVQAGAENTGYHVATFLDSLANKGKKVASLGFAKEPIKRHTNESFRLHETKSGSPLLIKTGEAPGFLDANNFAQNFVNAHLTLTYSGALALRPMTVIRDMYQGLMSVPFTGKYTIDAMKKMSPSNFSKAWNEARAAGALLDDIPVAGGELSMQYNMLHDIAKIGTMPNTAAANLARFQTYHGMKARVMDYGIKYLEKTEYMTDPKALAKEVKKFIDDSGIDFLHETFRKNEALPLLKARDITSLAERTALEFVRDTQFLYRQGNSPWVMRGIVGRLFGQFGTWPAWYIQYCKNLATRGSLKNRAKRIATFTALNATFVKAGEEIFGVDISSWLISNPFQWTSMPVEAWKAATTYAKGDAASDQEKAQADNVLQNQLALHIPGYLGIKGIADSFDEARTEDALRVALGFKKAEK